MRLTVLGCRGGVPSEGHPSSSYLTTTPGAHILLDCGPGAATALGAVLRPRQLGAVVISHLHLDHCYDLLPIGRLLMALRMRGDHGVPKEVVDGAGAEADPPIPLYVPEGGRALLDQLIRVFPIPTLPILERAFEVAFDTREYRPNDSFVVGDCEVSLHPLRHAIPNCGIRVESEAGTLAYTGDTGMTDGLLPLARDVNVFLAEATRATTDNGAHGHLSATEAGRAAAEAGADTLILTHLVSAAPSWVDAQREAAQSVYGGRVLTAEPGAVFDVRAPENPSTVPGEDPADSILT
ncbi:MBL fold metallo-hydrolase [Pseudofrankia sp. BMG5.36]|nr:MBL fold metallo-hydrolase [Pseudofrankia sp. BMG5.36]